jgi:TusE/DsrC/DsvC family sulfur relay protein
VEVNTDPSGTSVERVRQLRTVAGRTIPFDLEGFFWEAGDWCEEAAEALAMECGLPVLSEVHWRVILFLRAFFSNNGRAPLNRQLKEGTLLSMRELEDLFPGGIKYGARRLAGLPNPKTCG